jgi:HPt (histidine-containing phosphotransfer) domain-containing protein
MTDVFVVNHPEILERLGGDEEILAMMFDMFQQDLEGNCAALVAAIASGRPEEIRREAHTVKGLLATFSDAAGADAAYAVEQQAKAGNMAGLADAARALERRMREVAAALAADR